MRRATLIIAMTSTALLTGCVSTRDPFIAAPTQTLHSDRKPDDIDYCLANAYAVVHPAVRQKRDDGSIRIAFRNAMTGGLRFAVNLTQEGSGSKVEFYKGQDSIKWAEGCF